MQTRYDTLGPLRLSLRLFYPFQKHAEPLPVFRLLSPIVSRTFWFSTLTGNRIKYPTMYQVSRMRMHGITEAMFGQAVPQMARVESLDLVLDESEVCYSYIPGCLVLIVMHVG